MTTKIDKAILKVVAEAPEALSIKNIMFKLDKANLHEGKSMRAIADRVYAMRRDGTLQQVGIGSGARYTMPTNNPPATERAQQVAEGRRQEQPHQLGPCDLIDLGDRYVLTPIGAEPPTVVQPDEEQTITPPPTPSPASVIVLDSRQPTEEPFSARVAAIAQHIGTTVTLTVQQLISEALREKEGTIQMQRQEIAQLGKLIDDLGFKTGQQDEQVDQLKRDIAEQEQLYNELDTRYNTLKKRIAGLAQD